MKFDDKTQKKLKRYSKIVMDTLRKNNYKSTAFIMLNAEYGFSYFADRLVIKDKFREPIIGFTNTRDDVKIVWWDTDFGIYTINEWLRTFPNGKSLSVFFYKIIKELNITKE